MSAKVHSTNTTRHTIFMEMSLSDPRFTRRTLTMYVILSTQKSLLHFLLYIKLEEIILLDYTGGFQTTTVLSFTINQMVVKSSRTYVCCLQPISIIFFSILNILPISDLVS